MPPETVGDDLSGGFTLGVHVEREIDHLEARKPFELGLDPGLLVVTGKFVRPVKIIDAEVLPKICKVWIDAWTSVVPVIGESARRRIRCRGSYWFGRTPPMYTRLAIFVSGGPTRPSAPRMPGIVWHDWQP